MRSIRANHNQIAVSAYAAETAINTAQTLDLSLLAQMSDIVQRDTRREHNGDEMTGREEPDTIYDLGKTVSLALNFEKAQPQHFAFLYGFGLGVVASAAAGALGFKKTITPISGDLDRFRSLPSFTCAQRLGKTIFKERFYSMFVDGVTATFARDSWVKLSGQCKGTGKSDVSVVEEEVEAAENATSLTLAVNAVAGDDAAGRLDAIHQIVVDLGTGAWTEVEFSAVSAATPAVINITAPGAAATTRTYKIVYAPDEYDVEELLVAKDDATSITLAANGVYGADAPGRLDSVHSIAVELTAGVWTPVVYSAASDATPAVITITPPGSSTVDVTYKVFYRPATNINWPVFPARVSQTPLRVSQMTFTVGGKWNGSAMVGGRELSSEINSVEHSLANNGVIEFTPGADGAYANSYFRDGRAQALKLDRELRDYIVQNYMGANETFAATILAEGAEYEDGYKYQVRLIFPKLGVLSAPITANGKRLAEQGDLIVMEDDTYGSVIVEVQDLAEYYAA
jgi:hypothetical protein